MMADISLCWPNGLLMLKPTFVIEHTGSNLPVTLFDKPLCLCPCNFVFDKLMLKCVAYRLISLHLTQPSNDVMKPLALCCFIQPEASKHDKQTLTMTLSIPPNQTAACVWA